MPMVVATLIDDSRRRANLNWLAGTMSTYHRKFIQKYTDVLEQSLAIFFDIFITYITFMSAASQI